MQAASQNIASSARAEMSELRYSSLALTNPDRYWAQTFSRLCDIIRVGIGTAGRLDGSEATEQFAAAREALSFLQQISERRLEPSPRQYFQRMQFEEDFRGMRQGSTLVFMGLDSFQHQMSREERYALFAQHNLAVGKEYEIAQTPSRERGRSFAIIAPSGEMVELCHSYFGRAYRQPS